MTREEAIDVLKAYLMFDKSSQQVAKALNMAIEALSTESNCKDCKKRNNTTFFMDDEEALAMEIEALTEPINCVKCKHYYETEDGTDVHGHCRMDTAHTDLNGNFDYIKALDLAIEAHKENLVWVFNTAQTYGKSSAIEQLEKEPHGFTADEWYRDTFGENDGK